MTKTYELIIVGAGPAGITASIYAARKKMNFLVITKDIGGQTALSGEVENYTGYQYITGFDLAEKFNEHLAQFNIELKFEEVASIVKTDKEFQVITNRDVYRARAIIIATGARPKMLNVPGEIEFKNRGVTYCATCDAPLFAEKDVAVIGGGNSALDATLQLMKIANKIYLITIHSQFRGDNIMFEKIRDSKKVSILYNTRTLEILGDQMVKGLRVTVGKEDKILHVQGIFIEIGYVPNSYVVKDLVSLNELGEIIVDNHNSTNVPGIFAAGDVTNTPYKQIIVAAGEGAKASLSAFEFLSRSKII
jgi:alkyl hydroperoxide reductase subunit F